MPTRSRRRSSLPTAGVLSSGVAATAATAATAVALWLGLGGGLALLQAQDAPPPPAAQAGGENAAGQAPAVELDETPTFRTEANYVRVDLYATIDGEPVTDLRPEEIAIFDEGVQQRLDQFEYVFVRGNTPEELRREPRSVAESREMLRTASARVFVLFLDLYHVRGAASRTIAEPLVQMLDDLIGVDDLVAVMTPDMSVGDVTFGRKTGSIRGLLDRYWWGRSDRQEDLVTDMFTLCYPPTGDNVASGPGGAMVSPVALELILRRREKDTLNALEQLVTYLRDVREERKAILTITEGWRLYKPDPNLLNAEPRGFLPGRPRGIDTPFTDPQGANVRTRGFDCDLERQALAQLDLDERFLRMLDRANRANASFYPVDPRGLVVFEGSPGETRPLDLPQDATARREKLASLRTAADFTDGLAVVNTNNIRDGLQRIVTDLSSYYLLGYAATGVEMDGKFHEVRVRVNRPGVKVRARRGYLAPSAEELDQLRRAEELRAAAESRPPEVVAAEAGLSTALGGLARYSRDVPLRLHPVGVLDSDGGATFWAVGELGSSREEREAWQAGGEAEVTLLDAEGTTLASTQATLEPGARSFLARLVPSRTVAPGEYRLRVQVQSASPGSLSSTDAVSVSLASRSTSSGAVYIRRGQVTGNRYVVTADLRFRRTERLRVEVPVLAMAEAPTARLLDRNGNLLAIPVTAASREDQDGTHWVTAELVLAPLAPADYVVEIAAGAGSATPAEPIWAGFRLVP